MGTKKIGHLKDGVVLTIFAHVKAKKKQESSIRRSEVAAKKASENNLNYLRF